MKRLFHVLGTLSILLVAFGCAVSTTTLSSTTSATQTTTSTTLTTTTTSTVTTADERLTLLESEFVRLSGLIPESTTEDLDLPLPLDPSVTVAYSVAGVPVSQNRLAYDFPAANHALELTVELSIGEISISRAVSIVMTYDEVQFAAHQMDLAFSLVDSRLEEFIPLQITSDFTLPTIPDLGVEVTYSVDRSSIYNHRFIFDFPISDAIVTVQADVTIGEETRSFDYPVLMKGLASLPRITEVFIETENQAQIVSKDEYINGTLRMITYDENNQPTITLPTQAIEIRGRGNSTFYMPKMPYRIKFPNKTPITGEYSEKTWVFLANFTDQSLLRNYLAYNLAGDIGMAFAPTTMFADVYVNGNYVGNYLITDQIEVTSNRVNVQRNSAEADTGYLIELDQRLIEIPEGVENWDYFNLYGYYFTIKYPKTDEEYYSVTQFNYIVDYMTTLFQTLMNHQDYTSLIDVDSFVDWFIVTELFKNVDAGFSSVYFHKDAGQPLKMGPIWDFDLSSGNQQPQLSAELRGPEGWYTARIDKNPFFYYLMQYESFQTALKTRWNELYSTEILGVLDQIYPVSDSISYSRYQNFLRWDVIGKNNQWYTNPEILALDTYEEQTEFLYQYLATRMAWLNDAINDL